MLEIAALSVAVAAFAFSLLSHVQIRRVTDSYIEHRWLGRLEEIETRTATLRAAAHELLDQAEGKRARAAAYESATRRKKANGASGETQIDWTIDTYRQHLERGGRRLPEVEQLLGL